MQHCSRETRTKSFKALVFCALRFAIAAAAAAARVCVGVGVCALLCVRLCALAICVCVCVCGSIARHAPFTLSSPLSHCLPPPQSASSPIHSPDRAAAASGPLVRACALARPPAHCALSLCALCCCVVMRAHCLTHTQFVRNVTGNALSRRASVSKRASACCRRRRRRRQHARLSLGPTTSSPLTLPLSSDCYLR